jgi:hypothetical protein
MLKRSSVLVVLAFVMFIFPPGARAAGKIYRLNVKGALLNSFSPTTCGDELGDTYDTFCPSGSCRCLQYDDPDKIRFSGDTIGSAKAGTVHFTYDGGDDGTGVSGHSGLGCNPVFGEMEVPGSKDNEIIFFNGSICQPQANSLAKTAVQKMTGGWSIHSSSHGINAYGTFTGNFLYNAIGFNMRLTGEIH